MRSAKRKPSSTIQVDSSVTTIHWSLPQFSTICPANATAFPTVVSPKFYAGVKNGKSLIWDTYVRGKAGNIACRVHLPTSNWKDGVHKDDDDDLEADYKTLGLCDYEENELKVVKCSFIVGFGNSKNNFVHVLSAVALTTGYQHYFTAIKWHWGWTNFISISDLYRRRDDLLEDDTLRVSTQLTICSDNKLPVASGQSVDHLPHYLSGSFLAKKFSDCQIKCGKEIFNCHKVILAARSSVFNAMFDSDMKEAVQNEVDIKDMMPVVVKTLLKYIYTGTLDRPQNCTWAELIYGAEKYGLKELKQLCFEEMFKTVTNDNFGSLFLIAESYKAKPQFKDTLQAYYKRNMTKLMENSNFRKVLGHNFKIFYPDFEN